MTNRNEKIKAEIKQLNEAAEDLAITSSERIHVIAESLEHYMFILHAHIKSLIVIAGATMEHIEQDGESMEKLHKILLGDYQESLKIGQAMGELVHDEQEAEKAQKH